METYAQVLLYAIPGFVVLIAIETIYSYFIDEFSFRSMDIISSLSSGLTNILKSILGLTFIIISYDFVVARVALMHFEADWVVYLIGFIALDFASYCHHVLAHKINIFWNRHVIHHSGEDFNLATALRQSISAVVSLSFIFLFPAALLGIPAKVIAVIGPLHLFSQFWYHTDHIGKLGFLEYIIVTPSQHRVHHAINPIYLDKNLAAIFCVWDRMFGTFQEELPEHPCVYGVTRQVNTWNPIKINLNHISLLAQDAWRTNNWWDKLRIWFMPTGWRPADVVEQFPVVSADPNNFSKYNPQTSTALKTWSWIQFVVLVGMMWHFLLLIADIPSDDLLIFGAFLFMMVYTITTLMDTNKNALWTEVLKSAFGLGIIYWTGDWFLVETLVPFGVWLVIGYLIFSVFVVGWFVRFELGNEVF